ncbi:MAG: response regulator [Bryobacteraceae bacterium]
MLPSRKSPSTPQLRILVVDDNANGLAARRCVLEELGHKITTAKCGNEAFALFEENRFDLLVTDYKMPRMNGVELISKVRSLRPEVPIILISGFADALGLDEDTTGADAVIQKSANEVSHLMRAVNRLLRKAAPKKPARSQASGSLAKRKTV